MKATPVLRLIFGDTSALALLVSNLLTLILAVVQGWELGVVMMIYWAQSVIIGFFNFFKIMSLKEFSTKGMKSNGKPVPETPKAKRETAFFFLVHYGFFHLIYFFVVGSSVKPQAVLNLAVGGCVATFFVNHFFSFLHNFQRDRERKPNIGAIMFFPYARILPMHLTIVFGFFLIKGPVGLIFFLLLKTGADLMMHGIEHAARHAEADG